MPIDPSTIPTLTSYDTAIDWPARLEREGPFLLDVLSTGPRRRIIDLGAGTGEHANWLAGHGFRVVGIEGVKERWEVARRCARPGVEHLVGDLGAVEAMVRGQFGGAICLGSTLPSLLGAESLSRMLIGVRRRLLPGAPFVAHQVNYDRVFGHHLDELPERRALDGDDELIFRRELELRDDGIVDIEESVSRRRIGRETQCQQIHRRVLFHQGWRHQELLTVLDVARFTRVESFGGFGKEPFDPDESKELVLVAT